MEIQSSNDGVTWTTLARVPELEHKNPCDANDILLSKPGGWVLGTPGQTCNEVCYPLGGTCNSAMQSSLTSCALIIEAMTAAGGSCPGNTCAGSRDYAGSPF